MRFPDLSAPGRIPAVLAVAAALFAAWPANFELRTSNFPRTRTGRSE